MIYNLILLISSIFIYVILGYKSLFLVILSIIFTYYVAKFIKNNKVILSISIVFILFILILFKYIVSSKLIISSILSPLGISYYSLQLISYLVDVYRGKYKFEKNIIIFSLYILYIPHLFIGPIIKYDDMKNELLKKKKFSWDHMYMGLQRIVWGLSKKIIIAARIQIIINNIVSKELIGLNVFVACLLYSIELYCDFSGGIDIILGMSKIIDLKLPENFNCPFKAENVKEFWNLWHISLGNWLKEYIYIPLGGNRKGKTRQKINVLLTFIISGLWHGLSYILWGVLNGIFVILGKSYNTNNKWINRTINFLIISLLWIFFIYGNTVTSLKMLFTLFADFKLKISLYGVKLIDYIIITVFVLFLIFYDTYKEKINDYLNKLRPEIKTCVLCTSIIIVIILGMYGIGFKVQEFIYSKF